MNCESPNETKHSIIIEWSPEDECFLAYSPEWPQIGISFGDTREEALDWAQSLLSDVIDFIKNGEDMGPIPEERHFNFERVFPEKPK